MPATDHHKTTRITADWLALAGLLVFTLLVRGGVLWAMRANLQQDPDAYREIAENLLRHGEFALGKGEPDAGRKPFQPTAYRPPLYPVVLSNLPTADGQHVSLAEVAVLHLVLGVATVWLVWLTAMRLFAIASGPEARQEIAPTVRSRVNDDKTVHERSGGPTPSSAGSRAGPSGLDQRTGGPSQSPTSRSGLLPVGPPGLALAPLMAGFVIACDPILLNQQTLVMTETLAAFLEILSLWCVARFDQSRSWFNAGLVGGATGLAVLCRPTFLPWLGLVALTMLVVHGRKSEFRIQNSEWRWLDDFGWRLANVAGLCVAAAAVISPWAIRNYRVFGKSIMTTTHGGYTFLLGNNDSFYNWLEDTDSELPWTPPADLKFPHSPSQGIAMDFVREAVGADVDELGYSNNTYQFAFETIHRRPLSFTRACLYRLRQLWSPLPHKLTKDESAGRQWLRYATCAWYCGIYALAAIGVWRLRWKLLQPPWIWGVLLCLAFTAVHTFYWTNLRMRAPLMPFIAIVAAAAFYRSNLQA